MLDEQQRTGSNFELTDHIPLNTYPALSTEPFGLRAVHTIILSGSE